MKKILFMLSVIAFKCGYSQVPAYVPTVGLVAHYPFSGNTNDASGNNHTGTASNVTLTTDRFNVGSSAYIFNGSSSGIQLNTTNTVSFPNGVTYCAWVSAVGFTNSSVVDDQDGVLNPDIGFRLCVRSLSSPTPVVASAAGWYGSGVAAYSTSQYSLNTWSFIAASWGTDDSLRVYFNGIQQQSIYSVYNYTNAMPIYIGRGRLNSGYEVFNGKIDEVSIFNRVISKCEMYGMYTGTLMAMPITGVTNTICSGTSLTLAASGLNTYSWTSLGSGSSVTISPSTTTAYSVTGTHTLTGCKINSVIPISVNPLPTISITGPNAICIGNTASLSVSGASTYSWSSSSSFSNIAVSPTVTTSYSVIGTHTNGCSNSASKSVTVNALPTLTVSGVNVICIGNSASLSVTGASTYSWSTSSTASNVVVSPSVTSSYSVLGTDGNGCVNSAIKSVTVNALPILTISGVNAICIGNTASLSVTGASTYSWSTSSTASNIFVSPTITSSYSVFGTDGNGCINSATKTITVNALPVLNILGPNSVCIGSTVSLSVAGASTYTWSTNSSATIISVSPTVTSSYSVIGTDGNGCITSSSKSVAVNALPALSISGPNSICIGNTANLLVTGASTYSWSTSSTASSISVSPTITSSYSVIGTDGNGCVNSSVKTLTVNALPSLTLSGSNAICIGSTASLSVTGALTYTWNTNSSATSIAVSPTVTTNYTVIGTDNNSCSSSATKQIIVNPLPLVNIISTTSVICKGDKTTLYCAGANTYSWSTSQTGSVISISPTITTIYSVTGTDLNGCSNSASFTQNVAECLGIEQLKKENSVKISIFPNPNNGEFKLVSSKETRLLILNCMGQVMRKVWLNIENNLELEINDLNKGIYFLINDQGVEFVNQRIVVN